MVSKNTKYLIFSAILVILSIAGILLLLNKNKTGKQEVSNNIPNTENITKTPTPEITISPIPQATLSAKIASSSSTSAKKVTPTLKPTTTPKPTAAATITPTTTSTTKNYESPTDGFKVTYSSQRKLVQDTEATGNRYTFTSNSGNFAIHVATDDKWAWSNPSRDFTNDYLVAGQPTFKYEITTQTIIDFKYKNKNYTIQCIHNNNAETKAECEAFIKSITVQ